MGGKKQPGRFTIQFNAADPQQRQVIELLNQQGWRKAVFLTCAVLAYCGQTAPTAFQPPVLESALVEQIVQKVLQEKADRVFPQTSDRKETSPSINQTVKKVPKVAMPASAEELSLSENDLSAICGTIDAFRR